MAKRGRLLIVDEDTGSRDVFKEILEADGFTVIPAENGDVAMTCLKREPVDLVFTDYVLPGMNGLALLERIRALSKPPGVIFVTAYGTIDSAVEAIKRGASGYITKPLTRERLLHLTRKAVE